LNDNTEIIRPEKNLLQKAAFSGALIPFYRLEYSFPMESNAFVLAYEQSQTKICVFSGSAIWQEFFFADTLINEKWTWASYFISYYVW